MKHVKQSIMSDEIANQDIGNTAKKVNSSEEAMEVIKEMQKIIRSNKYSIYGLPTNKLKYLKDLNLITS